MAYDWSSFRLKRPFEFKHLYETDVRDEVRHMSHHPLAVARPLSTFVMEVLPWAASGAIGVYLLWATCLAPDSQTQVPAQQPALSSLAPATEQGPTATHRTFGVAALPDLMADDQPLAQSM
jgi:hypothetical protein